MPGTNQRFLTPPRRRAAAWVTAVFVAACSSSTTDLVSGGSVATVSVSPPTSTVSIGAQLPLQAIVQDAKGQAVSSVDVHWSIQNSAIATISSDGVVTGIALGSTQVAASAGGKSGIGTITVEKTPVASVAVAPTHVDASPGDHPVFSATAYDASQNALTDRTILWSTSNANVATVDGTGLATAVGPGNATITASAEGKNGTATITVSQAPVATVTVTPSPLSMSVGQSTQMTATLTDAGGNTLNGRTVTWSSSNTGVATMSQQGVLNAVSPGSTTITATSEGKTGTAAVTITNVAVGSVVVQPQGPSILQGASVQLSATVRDVNGTVVTDRVVTWTSSAASVASVSSSGVVTGVGPGSTTITATSEGKAGSSTVTVIAVPVGSVTVSPTSQTVRVLQTATLTATVKDSLGHVVTNRVVTWASSNALVATVSGGVVTGVLPGTATITATSEGKSGTATVNVTLAPVGNVSVSPASQNILISQAFPLSVTVKDSAGNLLTGRTVTWGSSNTAAATVSQQGVVTGIAQGASTITATSEGKSGSSAVTVSPVPVAAVVVSPNHDSLAVSGTVQLTATPDDSVGHPLTGRVVSWGSSNGAVATVSSSGLVTAVALGTATITATSEGKSGTSAITVYVPVASVAVTPATSTILTTQSQTFTATAKDGAGNTLTGRAVTWTSTPTTVATITQTGVATAVAPGTATITATSGGKTGTATLTVNPVPVASVTITPPSPDTVYLTYTTQLSVVTKDSAGGVLTGRTVTWASVAPGIASVSTTGLVSGVTAGSTQITATSEGKVGSVTMVAMKAPVGSVVVSPATDSVTNSGAANSGVLSAAVKDVKGTVVTDRVVNWTSSATANATVAPASGASTTVTGKAVGSTNVTATSEGKSGTSVVNVIAAIAAVHVNPPLSALSLSGTKTVQLTATCADALANSIPCRSITWSATNGQTAVTLTPNGAVVTVTANPGGSGPVTITAKDTYDNVSGTATVSVGP